MVAGRWCVRSCVVQDSTIQYSCTPGGRSLGHRSMKYVMRLVDMVEWMLSLDSISSQLGRRFGVFLNRTFIFRYGEAIVGIIVLFFQVDC